MTASADVNVHLKLLVICELANDNLVRPHVQHSSSVTHELVHFEAVWPVGKETERSHK